MKNLVFSMVALLCLFSMYSHSFAQLIPKDLGNVTIKEGLEIGVSPPRNPCTNFNNQNLSNWKMYNNNQGNITHNSVMNLNAQTATGASGNSGDFALNVRDMGGSTWIYNKVNFRGNYLQNQGKCLCFDFQLNNNNAALNPTMVLASNFDETLPIVWGSNPATAAIFTAANTVTPNSGWVHICAPLNTCNGSTMPSNTDGSWSMLGNASCSDWQTLLGGVTHLMFAVDMSGWPGQEDYDLDNICIDRCPVTNDGDYCCEGKNLIPNGNFEQGNRGFNSQYTYQSNLSSIGPGNYSVVDDAQANQICPQWKVKDHTACSGGANSKFMVVNGRTTQPASTNRVVWEHTFSQLERGEEYKFCANFKNLPQCCFDIQPKVQILVNGTPITPPTTVNTGTGVCDWQEIETTFTAGNGPSSIQIRLDESGQGDGNDLAIDDIFLKKMSKAALNISVQHNGANNQVTASINGIGSGDDALPSPECKYFWIVAEASSHQNPTFSNWMWGNATTQGWNLTTTFPNYNGGTPHGHFDNNKLYVVALFVYDCDCYADNFTYQYTFDAQRMAARMAEGETKALPEIMNPDSEATAILQKQIQARGKELMQKLQQKKTRDRGRNSRGRR